MTVKTTARKQYAETINNGSRAIALPHSKPPEGWLATFRQALGMSLADVATRLNQTRASIHQAERNEAEGKITLAQMEKIASAMGGRVVYSIVPDKPIEEMIRAQARAKAEACIRYVDTHMALEKQALSDKQNQQKIDELADELVRTMPRGFWNQHDRR